jgi:aminopeptidase
MVDQRLLTLAKNLVNYSCAVKKGEKVLIDAVGVDYPLLTELVKAVFEAGGYPFVEINDQRVNRQLLMGTAKKHLDLWAKYDVFRMNEMDAYIGVRGGHNTSENGDVPQENLTLYSTLYSQPVHHNIRVEKTKWVVLRYPNPSMAQQAAMSSDKFEDFYFKVCNLDYAKMDKAMDSLSALMAKTDRVKIVGKDTDLEFSIKGIKNKKCSGHMNIPDGEVYTAPVKTSVNGIITYNAPSFHDGLKYENVALTFKDGKIIKATSNFSDRLNEALDTDAGARYIGEFSFGVNPYITEPMGDILFDEKISGSIHFTPGSCYKDAYNGNESALHWDLVHIQTPKYGGGEIYLDGKLIRKDGKFVLKQLECLNPENLI